MIGGTHFKALLAAGFLVASWGVADAAEFEWKYYTYNSPTEQQVQVSRDFVNDVNKSSDGRLKITLFTYGELPFKPNEVVRAVATNKVHMGTGGIPFHEGDIPELNVYSQPFVCTSYQGYAPTLPYVEPIIEKYMRDKFNVSLWSC